MSDEKVIAVIQKMLKKGKESVEQFEKGGRQDLVEKEKQEMSVLSEFIPVMMTSGELEKIVSDVVAELKTTSVKDMGKVMKEVMARAKGRADGQAVSAMVKSKLN